MPTIPVYYINLAARPDRRAFMEHKFAQLGITAERVEAVRMDEVPPALVEWHRTTQSLWRLAEGDLACGLSHQRSWERLLDSGAPAALILEDDVELAAQVLDFLDPGLVERLGADLLKLETFHSPVKLGSAAQQVGATTMRELCSSQMGGAAYILSRDAARASLLSPLRNQMGIDRFLFGRGGYHLLRSRVLQAIPSPCIQIDKLDAVDSIGESNIAGTRTPAPDRPQRDLGAVIGLHLDHVGRLVRLASRDFAALRGPRVVVPFAGTADPA
ncbi:MAG TPA: glycosyltransferase family 25 protein [Devosia sp.]|jgi:GR25 family glycosyltransferase involved in LPS biosynthesis|uniref:glycosyltransferase family 25 protein n=1 Tax=Devosia sp. TaxID=1871048 RepID=UPI002DDDA725|nr:glycosyltransferase family 25 protein [Devosia sp.]HEV2518561.1 glycosyltransferase family 25 protein [Devosia sp.]